jgi:hypothetical protein
MRGAKPPSYLSLLNYFRADRRTEAALEEIRELVRDRTKMATVRGYGPRYLHSIGQLYKGGARRGLFFYFVRAKYGKLAVPGQPFDFGQLIYAQAIGDAQAMIARKRPTLVLAVDGKPAEGLEYFARVLRSVLART